MQLRPFFSYFGGKWRAAPHYPAPAHGRIVEPFAGSAGYAVRHAHLDVLLLEKSEPIAAVWDYLIKVSPEELLALPLLDYGQKVDDVPGLTQEQRWLIGLWCNPGSSQPKKTLMHWPAPDGSRVPMSVWGDDVRARLARQVPLIRHWKILHADYSAAPDVVGTWFVDPPYQYALGRNYPCGSKAIDFAKLADWCRARRGQTIVCEAQGADWLPFQPLGQFKANARGSHKKAKAAEAIWLQDSLRADVAALFVDPKGIYAEFPCVDPWDASRDARLYSGPHPVVAHPPCARWCQLAGLVEAVHGHKRGDDGGCFAAALEAVRKYGGVLEHPAWTLAWPAFGLSPPPAFGWQKNIDGSWVCEVAQSAYGNPCRKLTWLYYVGDAPPEPAIWTRPKRTKAVSQLRNHWNAVVPRASKREASATPRAFAEFLLRLARSAQRRAVAA